MKKTIYALIATMCFIGMVAAVDDTSTVSAQVKAKITISDVANVDLGALYPIQTYYSADMPITVQSNKDWQVDATASNNGLMTDGTVTLGHNMYIKLEGSTGYGSLSGAPYKIYDDVKPGTAFNTKVSQSVDYSDSPSDAYSITLTFAATQVA